MIKNDGPFRPGLDLEAVDLAAEFAALSLLVQIMADTTEDEVLCEVAANVLRGRVLSATAAAALAVYEGSAGELAAAGVQQPAPSVGRRLENAAGLKSTTAMYGLS